MAEKPTNNPLKLDPRRGPNLSPTMQALLCFLTGAEPMTKPQITGLLAEDGSVFAATTDDPDFNTVVGAVADAERNIRIWSAECNATEALTMSLLRKIQDWPE